MDTEGSIEQAMPDGWLVGWLVVRLGSRQGRGGLKKWTYLRGGDQSDLIDVVGLGEDGGW